MSDTVLDFEDDFINDVIVGPQRDEIIKSIKGMSIRSDVGTKMSVRWSFSEEEDLFRVDLVPNQTFLLLLLVQTGESRIS